MRCSPLERSSYTEPGCGRNTPADKELYRANRYHGRTFAAKGKNHLPRRRSNQFLYSIYVVHAITSLNIHTLLSNKVMCHRQAKRTDKLEYSINIKFVQKNTLSAVFLHRFVPVYSLNTLRSGAIIVKMYSISHAEKGMIWI